MGKGISNLSYWIKMTDWCKDPAWLSHFGSFLIVMVAMLAGAPAQCQNGNYEKEKKPIKFVWMGHSKTLQATIHKPDKH
ncbi:MAG: hypothetical protein IPL73_24705 [Candidatus Obscuribacter sp.]|nr:hypothetical protein [Candidatus Obscuribacter sp.]